MPSPSRPSSRKALIALGVTMVIVFMAASIPALRHGLLRSAGEWLVADDPPARADVIVMSSDSLGAGALEAADLVKAGYAAKVAIFDRLTTPAQAEFHRRGLPFPDPTTVSRGMLQSLGIAEVAVIPAAVGTVDEGEVLQRWCLANSIHSVLFVSVTDHSRRTRRVLHRTLERSGISVTVRYARFSDFDPGSWWQTRGGQRVEIVELQKLALDFLRHPF